MPFRGLGKFFDKRSKDVPGFDPEAYDEDSAEMREPYFDAVVSPLAAGSRFGLIYKDADGHVSRRVVQISSVNADELSGHCELRDAYRTFFIDRIEALVDTRTGEIFEDSDDLLALLQAGDIEIGQAPEISSSGLEKGVRLIEEIGDELRVLMFVAESDGKFARAEEEILLKYSKIRGEEVSIELSGADLAVLRKWMRAQRPNQQVIEASISRLADRGVSELESVWEVAEILIEADGVVDPGEITALSAIREALLGEVERRDRRAERV